jgi:hypothetical protein
MNKVLMSTILLYVALNATAAVQTDKAPPLPEVEEASYIVTDKLKERVLGAEVWIGNRQTFNIYIDEELVYVVQKRRIGARVIETHNAIGEPFVSSFAFPEYPEQQPNGTTLAGSYSLVSKINWRTQTNLRATAETNQVAGKSVVIYQVLVDDQSLQTITTYTSQAHLPISFELIEQENGVIIRHTLKTRQK